MILSTALVLPTDAMPPAELLHTLLAISLTGFIFFRPVYAADGKELIDLAYDYLNPAAQQMLGLPEHPAESFLTRYPMAVATDVFAFYQAAFLSDTPLRQQVSYAHDGLDGYYHLVAKRSTDLLLVSFTDALEQPRPAVEDALRASQASEQAARAEAERARTQVEALLQQAPVALALFEGPELRISLANERMSALWGRPLADVLHQPLLAAVPELQNQGFEDLMHQVQATRVPFVGTEVPTQLPCADKLATPYYNFVCQPFYDAQGEVRGVLDVAVEVTEQVRARQQVQALNEELLAANQDMQAMTHRLEEARAAGEAQRQELHALLTEAPAGIARLAGPDLTFTFTNALYQQMFGNRPLLGKPYHEALPELADQPFFDLLDAVYRTGKTYYGRAMPAWVDRTNTGRPERGYYDFSYQATYDEAGTSTGILIFAYEVTEAVLARQSVEQQEHEANQFNEELAAANEEIRANNVALTHTQHALHALNEELEARVAQRTTETRAALAEAQAQREQLRQQQGLLSQILGQVPACIAHLSGPQHRFSFFNDQYQALAAGRAQLGGSVAELLPEMVGQGFIDLLDRVYTTGQPFVGHETPILLHGPAADQASQHYLDFIYQPLFDAQGQPHGILVFGVDTTATVLARRQADSLQGAMLAAAQRRVHEREAFYQVLEQTPAAICMLRGPEHRYEYVNETYQQFFPGQMLSGRPIVGTLPAAGRQGFLNLLNGVYDTGEAYYGYELPLPVAQPAGHPPRLAYFNFTYSAYREGGQIAGISIFGYEVTEVVLAKQQREAWQAELLAVAERQAQEREALFRLFEHAPVAVVLLRAPDHRIEYYNALFGELYAGMQLQGRAIAEVFPEWATSEVMSELDRVYQTGEPYQRTDIPLVGSSPGTLRYISIAYQAYWENNQIAGVAVFIHEVTEQVLARQQVLALNEETRTTNQALHDTNTRLTRTNADLDTFVYTASHDLKVPIANIEGLLDALRRDLRDYPSAGPVVPRILGMMQDAVVRFQQTIGHLTDISRLQQEAGVVDQTSDLATILADVQLDLMPLLETTGARMTIALAGMPALPLSPKNLRSVVYNLLSNALKYRDATRPPRVRVACEVQASHVVLHVQDNGLGLRPDQQAGLFELFRRLHDHVDGSGVGLYMVKKIVENAGGTIAVQSQAGVGSTFSLTLPLAS